MDTETNNNATSFGAGSFFFGVLIGAVVGGISALLMAPKSGAETRGMVKDRFEQVKGAVRSRVKGTGENMEEVE